MASRYPRSCATSSEAPAPQAREGHGPPRDLSPFARKVSPDIRRPPTRSLQLTWCAPTVEYVLPAVHGTDALPGVRRRAVR